MSTSFTTTFTTSRTPSDVFDAIRDVRGWWTGNVEGSAGKVGDQFTYDVPGVHRTVQRVAELIPARRVVWNVLESELGSFDDAEEWTGTVISFHIDEVNGDTRVKFTHEGLVPEFECYEACSGGWRTFVAGSLRSRIENGPRAKNDYTDDVVEFVRKCMSTASA